MRDAALARSPLQRWFERRRRDRLAVLTYHRVPDAARFARHLDVLESMGTFVSLADVLNAMDDGGSLPPHSLLVTFDDGDRTLIDVAAAVLADRGIPAVVFVVTDVIGTADPFWWTEVEELVARGGHTRFAGDGRAVVNQLKKVDDVVRREALLELRETATSSPPPVRQLDPTDLQDLVAAGIAVGSHTMTHPCLTRCAPDVVAAEVEGSRDALTAMLDSPPLAFAYPNGELDATSVKAVEDAGYRVAFRFDHRLTDLPIQGRFSVSRLRTSEHVSADRLRILVSGLHPALHHARGRS